MGKSKAVQLKVSKDVLPEMNIGFDKKIPKSIRMELCKFINWVEDNYSIPITLWVDFEYKHYLISREGKRVGFLFYWSDFSDYPCFENQEDIPMIRLPVRTECSTFEEILSSFIEALTLYFAWICGEISEDYTVSDDTIDEILDSYYSFRG